MGRQKVALCSREHQLVWYEKPFDFFFLPQGDPGIQGYHGRKVSKMGREDATSSVGNPRGALLQGCTQPGLGG